VQSFPNHKAHRAALISVSLILSQTPAYIAQYRRSAGAPQLLLVYSLRLPTKEWPCSVDLYCRYIHNQESLPTQVLTVPVSINVVDQQRPMLPPDQPATNLLYLLTSAENNKKPSCRYRRPTDLLI